MKICSRCHIEKDDSEFRIRVDKRENPPLVYLNSTCMDCDAQIAKDSYAKKMANPENRKKHNEAANKRYWRRRDKSLQEHKAYRSKPENKQKRKEYIKKNKIKIAKQEEITKRRYHEKNRDKITDRYVVNLLRNQRFGTSEELFRNKELIEIKKTEVLISRLKKKVPVKLAGVKKICTRCLQEKDRSEFYKIGNTTKVMSICKTCSSEKCKKYREAKKNELSRSK